MCTGLGAAFRSGSSHIATLSPLGVGPFTKVEGPCEGLHATARTSVGFGCLSEPIRSVSDKQRYATKTVRTGKREAQKALAAMVVAAERGESLRTSATVGELLAAWLEVAEPDFSPKTVLETRGIAASYL